MAEVIKRFFEITGKEQQETRDLWIFVLGKHNSGKSALLKTFFENTPDQYRLEPSKSTFGYEYTVIQYKIDTFVHIVEANETGSENAVLVDLLKKHAEQAAIVVLFDSHEFYDVQKTVDELLIPLFETPLSELDTKLAVQYSKFLTTLWTDEPTALGNGVLSTNAGVPIFFVAGSPETLADFDDVKFDSMMKYIREPALTFAAGISLANSVSLLPVIISCINREPLSKELRDLICNRSDYFLPPGWDSPSRIENIQNLELTRENNEDENYVIKSAQEWQDFLVDLETIKHEGATPAPSKVAPVTVQASAASEPDFLSQFE